MQRLVMFVAVIIVVTACTATSWAEWSTPKNRSGWADLITEVWVQMNSSGDSAAFWTEMDTSSTTIQHAAAVKPSGKPWREAQSITGWMSAAQYSSVSPAAAVGPDGTVWFAWVEVNAFGQYVNVSRRGAAGSWTTEQVSSTEIHIRDVDVSVGETGDAAVCWVATQATNPSLSDQGPCQLYATRLFNGAFAWEPIERLDSATGNEGMDGCYVFVNNAGEVFVLWGQTSGVMGNNWSLLSRWWDPAATAWTPSSGTDTVVTGVEPEDPTKVNWLAQPVMNDDGSVLAAWAAKNPGGTGVYIWSATWQVASHSWSSPDRSSNIFALNTVEDLQAYMRGGYSVLAWLGQITGTAKAVYATYRDPGSQWSTESFFGSNMNSPDIMDIAMRQDGGEVLLLFSGQDAAQPAGSQLAYYWSMRRANSGGGWMSEVQLSGWLDELNTSTPFAAGVYLEGDESMAVWAGHDPGLPVMEQGALRYATRTGFGVFGFTNILWGGLATPPFYDAKAPLKGRAVNDAGTEVVLALYHVDLGLSKFGVFAAEWPPAPAVGTGPLLQLLLQ